MATRDRHGDEQAIDALLDRHADDVYDLALRLTGHAPSAERIAREVFREVALGTAPAPAGAPLDGWLHWTLLRVARGRWREAGGYLTYFRAS